MDYYSSLDASQLDSATPTLFEIISANQLEALLSPSLRYILVRYAQEYPGVLLKVANQFDELNFVLRSAIELYFINKWQSSFTENFYGLKRVTQTPLSLLKYAGSEVAQLAPSMVEECRRLTLLRKLVSVFEITGTAYLLNKLGYKYELLYSKFVTNQLTENASLSPEQNRRIRWQRLFVRIYPYLQTAWRLSDLVAIIMYLTGVTKSPSVLKFFFRIEYARLNSSDYSRNELQTSFTKTTVIRNRPLSKSEMVFRILTKFFTKPAGISLSFILRRFFPLAIFSLKFLEWWSNSEFAQTLAKLQNHALDSIVPPPSVLSKLRERRNKAKKVYRSGSTCPLCKENISNPAIIETGHVFCYTCIFNYLRNSHKFVKEIEREGSESESDDEYDSDVNSEKKDSLHERNGHSKKVEISANNEKTENDEAHCLELLSQSAQSSQVYTSIEISRGGRCPITGKKLLGCKWNELKGEFDVDGIRRLIF